MLLVKVFQELNKRKVRYLVAGGVAAILYGNPRFTKDLDLFVDLEEANLRKMIAGLKTLKFIPRAPVKADDFAVKENRDRWMKEKGMLAFTFINPKNPFENVDILLMSPVPFQTAYRKKRIFKSENTNIPVVSSDHLIQMKTFAGRPQDLNDIEVLKVALGASRRLKE